MTQFICQHLRMTIGDEGGAASAVYPTSANSLQRALPGRGGIGWRWEGPESIEGQPLEGSLCGKRYSSEGRVEERGSRVRSPCLARTYVQFHSEVPSSRLGTNLTCPAPLETSRLQQLHPNKQTNKQQPDTRSPSKTTKSVKMVKAGKCTSWERTWSPPPPFIGAGCEQRRGFELV